MVKITWPDIWFGPINLYSVWKMTTDKVCKECGGLIVDPNKTYGYAGKVCSCRYVKPQEYTYQDKMKLFTQPNSTDDVVKDLKDREQIGLKKYGEYVHESTDDMLQHAYEEVLDLAVYLKTEINRRNNGVTK